MTARGGAAGDDADLDLDLETDLDAAPRASPRSAPARPSRRRLGALVALVVVALVVALVVADRTRSARASEVLLEAVGGELLTAQGSGGDVGAVFASLRVELQNTGTNEVTLVAVQADGAGEALVDNMRGSGGESLGLERGLAVAPGATRTVELAGMVTCPPDESGIVEPAGLVVQALAADGTPRTVELAAPDVGSWRSALTSACALGPGDAFPNDQRPLFAGGDGPAAVVPAAAVVPVSAPAAEPVPLLVAVPPQP